MPDGADVKFADASGKSVTLQTPVIVSPEQCPSRVFEVAIRREVLLQKVQNIPEAQQWLAQLNPNFPGFGGGFRVDAFSTEHSRLGDDWYTFGHECVLTNYPKLNRACVLFIPQRLPVAVFFPIMPKLGTFNYAASVFQGEISNYLKGAQLDSAAQCLSRCGKFVTLVPDPDTPGGKVIVSLTANGGPPNYDVNWSVQGTQDFYVPWP